MTDAPETLLVLDGIGLAPCVCRFATQTLDPLPQAGANIYRDVNGILRSVAAPQFRKYKSVITCTDLWPFPAGGIWQGQLVTVDCVAHLSYLTDGGTPERDVVEGSEHVVGAFTYYRPRIPMMVISWRTSEDEARKDAPWSLDLEEV